MLFILISMQLWGQKQCQLKMLNTDFKQIKKHLPKKFKDSVALKNYLFNLQQKAYNKGYLLASIDKIERVEHTFQVEFTIGEKFKNAQLYLPENELKVLKRNGGITEKFLLNIPLSPSQFSRVMTNIQNTYLNLGYPFVNVYLDSIQIQNKQISAQIQVDKGPLLNWNKLHVKGDSSIHQKFVSNLIGIKPGEPYNETDFLAISKKIRQINYFDEIKPAELLFTKDGVDLYTYLSSKKLSLINGIIGLQPNPTTSKLSLTGEVTLKLQNILHRGEKLFLSWKSIQAQTQSLNSEISYPYLFNTKFGLSGAFDLYKRDSTFLEMTATAGVDYYFSGSNSIKAFYQFKSSDLLSGSNNSTFTNLGNVKTNSYGLSYFLNQVDYLPNPSRGVILESSISIGTRSSQITDTSTVIKSTVYSGSLNLSWFIPLAKRHVLLLRNRTHLYQAPVIYSNETHRFGGLNTLRGFNEQELYATAKSTFTTAYRFLVDKNSFAFAFFDWSWYENNAQKYYTDTPFGFGAGFSFGTKIGIFSISYALGKQFSNPIEFKNGKIHFGYIAYF